MIVVDGRTDVEKLKELLVTGAECSELDFKVDTFPDGRSALMLVTARLKYIAECEWGKRRYLDVSLLHDGEVEA